MGVSPIRPHVLTGRIIARLALLLQDLKLRLTLGTRPSVRFKGRLNGPDILHVGPNGRLGVVHRCQPPGNIAR